MGLLNSWLVANAKIWKLSLACINRKQIPRTDVEASK